MGKQNPESDQGFETVTHFTCYALRRESGTVYVHFAVFALVLIINKSKTMTLA